MPVETKRVNTMRFNYSCNVKAVLGMASAEPGSIGYLTFFSGLGGVTLGSAEPDGVLSRDSF